MRIGVPKEIKPAERRVSVTPAMVRDLCSAGHEVFVEAGAGTGSGFQDETYRSAGARTTVAEEVWSESELIVKVKEPLKSEYRYLREDLTLFTYLHLAADAPLTDALMASGTLAIAYETIEDEAGGLPLLAPMSEVAGRLAAQVGAYFMQSPQGGKGVLTGGAPGTPPAKVTVLGGGVAGTEAARVAVGMGAQVTVLEISGRQIRDLERFFGSAAEVLMSDAASIEEHAMTADLLIGAVLVPGAKAPKLISRSLLEKMEDRTVLVDVAIDQGGCADTSRPTTHHDPTFEIDGVLHYCVANMPGAVPATSTRALTNATRPYLQNLADSGIEQALESDPGLAKGVNVRSGNITNPFVAEALSGQFVEARV